MLLDELMANGKWLIYLLGLFFLMGLWSMFTSVIRVIAENWMKKKNGTSSTMRVTNSKLDTDVEKLLTQGARTNQLLEAQLDLTRAIKENQVRLSGQIETLVTIMTTRGVS